MLRKSLFSFLFFFWMALLSVLSLMPMDNFDLGGPEIPFLDKWVHLGFYCIAMLLGVFYLRERFGHRMKKKPAMLRMGIVLLVYGMVIEILQGKTGLDRSAELADLAANIAGIGLGAWLASVLLRKQESLNWPD